MGEIRKQAISNTIITYFGFLLGAVNIYFFTSNHTFTPAEFGLTRVMLDLAMNLSALSTAFGFLSVLFKFFPYYYDYLPFKKIDLLAFVVLFCVICFGILTWISFVNKPFVIKKFAAHSPTIIVYYRWLFIMAFSLMLYSIMDAWLVCFKDSRFGSFLREVLYRCFLIGLIMLYFFHFITFNTFIKLYTLLYFVLFLITFIYLGYQKRLVFYFRFSKVTKRLKKPIITLQGYAISGTIIATLAQTVEAITIAAVVGISEAGIYTLASYVSNIVQVSQRSIMGISAISLSHAWKDKNTKEVFRIYKRTCINMLLFALFVFGNIILNINHLYLLIGIGHIYSTGFQVVFLLGLTRVIDAGTGVNDLIIGTSTKWAFQFYSMIILIALLIPFNYFLIKELGMVGSAYAQLISYCLYNIIRFEYIRRKFKMQPFTMKNGLGIMVAVIGFFVAYGLFSQREGWIWLLLRSFVYSFIFIACTVMLKLSEDAILFWNKGLALCSKYILRK